MNTTSNLSYIAIEDYDIDWVGLCLDGALVYEDWHFDSRDRLTMIPSASKSVDGTRYSGKFWWTASTESVDLVPDQAASHLLVSVEASGGAVAHSDTAAQLRQSLVKQIEQLKRGTIADLPFDAGGNCVEE